MAYEFSLGGRAEHHSCATELGNHCRTSWLHRRLWLNDRQRLAELLVIGVKDQRSTAELTGDDYATVYQLVNAGAANAVVSPPPLGTAGSRNFGDHRGLNRHGKSPLVSDIAPIDTSMCRW